MKQKVVIARYPLQETETLVTVLYEDDKAVEMSVHRPDSLSILGNIYVGYVEKIEPSLHAAFVRFLPDQTGYLPLPAVTKRKAGDRVVVQVEKEALKSKLPRLTEKLSVAGRNLVLTSARCTLNVSKKLSESDRARMTALFEERYDHSYGMILRTNAAEVREEDLLAEWESLLGNFREIQSYGGTRALYSCLYQANRQILDVLYKLRVECADRVVTDDPKVYEELAQYFREHREYDGVLAPTLYQDDMVELYKLYNLTTRMTEIRARQVWLKSGGFLTIDQTEAFVCVDVNTGRYVSKKSKDETIVRTNQEALEETARQIRLRGLSGTILVDLINRKGTAEALAAYEQSLCTAMQQMLSGHRIPAKVIDITKLGIMEIACKKVARSFREQIEEIL